MPNLQLHAGAAEIDITPQPGVPLAGSLEGLISTHVLDPLHARVVVLESGGARVAFALLDLIALGNEDAAHARDLIGEAAGVLPENVCISCTHTHTGPCLLELFNSPRDAEYIEWMLPRVAEAAGLAAEKMQPARAAWGIGKETEAAFNRRFHLQGGKVAMNPGVCNPEIIRPAGPNDPQIPVLLLESLEGKPLAALANFSLHYVGDHSHLAISSDYFGQFAAEMKARHGDDFIALMTHGFSGDINAIDVHGEEVLPPTEKSRRIANRIANEIDAIWSNATFHEEVFISSVQTLMNVGVRKIHGEEIAIEEARKDDQSLTEAERGYARERLKLLEWPDEFPVIVQAMRVGDFATVAMPGEMFCRFGLDLKHASPFPVTAPIELANGYSGYMATQTDYILGGYETWLARSAFAAPGAGESMVVAAALLLRELAQQHPIKMGKLPYEVPTKLNPDKLS